MRASTRVKVVLAIGAAIVLATVGVSTQTSIGVFDALRVAPLASPSSVYNVCIDSAGNFSSQSTVCAGSAVTAHNLLSVTHSDTTVGTVVRGDLITGQGASATWKRLARGTSGYFVSNDGTDVTWSSDGSALTSLNATNVSSGTLNTARLPATLHVATGLQVDALAAGSALYYPCVNTSGVFSTQSTPCTSTVTAHNLLSTTHGDTVAASPVRGDVLIGNSTPKWTKLGVCSALSLVGSSDGVDTTCVANARYLTTGDTTNGDGNDALRDVHPGVFNPGTGAVSTNTNWTFETDVNDGKITLAINNRGCFTAGCGQSVPSYTSNGATWSGVGPLGFSRLQLQVQSEAYNSGGSTITAAGDDSIGMFTYYSTVWRGSINGTGAGTFTASGCTTDAAGAYKCPGTLDVNSSGNINFSTGGSTKWVRFQDQGNTAFVQIVANDFAHGYGAWGVRGMELETRSIGSTGGNMSSSDWVRNSLRARGHVGIGCGLSSSFARTWSAPAALCVEPPDTWINDDGSTTPALDVYGAEIWGPTAHQAGTAAALRLDTTDTYNTGTNYLLLGTMGGSGGATLAGIYVTSPNSGSGNMLNLVYSGDGSSSFKVQDGGSIYMPRLNSGSGGGPDKFLCLDANGRVFTKGSACV